MHYSIFSKFVDYPKDVGINTEREQRSGCSCSVQKFSFINFLFFVEEFHGILIFNKYTFYCFIILQGHGRLCRRQLFDGYCGAAFIIGIFQDLFNDDIRIVVLVQEVVLTL